LNYFLLQSQFTIVRHDLGNCDCIITVLTHEVYLLPDIVSVNTVDFLDKRLSNIYVALDRLVSFVQYVCRRQAY